MSEFDHVVIGGGIVGSFTARYLQSLGKNVALLEQFSTESSCGSSCGKSRVIRVAYGQPFFTQFMPEAYKMWKEIEELSQQQVIVQTGLIIIDKKPSSFIEKCKENVKKYTGKSLIDLNEKFTPEELSEFHYDSSFETTFEETGGIVLANKALAAIQELFVKSGGKIYGKQKVTNIKPGEIITIETSTESFRTPSLIICAGPWTNKLLKHLNTQLPIKTPKVRIYYWKEKEDAKQKFQSFIENNAIGVDVYGFSASEYPNHVKIAAHGGDECDPDQMETTGMKDEFVDAVSKYIGEHFPGVHHEKPSIVETCIYSETPDDVFILDHHPSYKNIVIGAGFCGTGFKMSPVTGKVLGNLALNIPTSYDLKPFSMSRFKNL